MTLEMPLGMFYLLLLVDGLRVYVRCILSVGLSDSLGCCSAFKARMLGVGASEVRSERSFLM
jgi:hypothetical protein